MPLLRLSKSQVAALLVLVIAMVLLLLSTTRCWTKEGEEFFQRPGVKVSEVIRACGFLAEDRQVVVEDGFVLTLTRATNPLIVRPPPNKDPILFVHGTLTLPNQFVVNSFKVRPKNLLRDIDVEGSSLEQLVEALEDEPSARSLPFLALNFGHEVWFLHRRGVPQSLKRLKLGQRPQLPYEKYLRAARLAAARRRKLAPTSPVKRHEADVPADDQRANKTEEEEATTAAATTTPTNNSRVIQSIKAAPSALLDYGKLLLDIRLSTTPGLWNYSLDEQAAYDMPRALDYVLEVSGRKRAALVGGSGGGALILMALIMNPELNRKVARVELWAPGFNMGHGTSLDRMLPMAQLALNYIGPFPLTLATVPAQSTMQLLCSLELAQRTVCERLNEMAQGRSRGQAPMRPDYFSHAFVSASTREVRQLLESAKRRATHFFNFNAVSENLAAYGSLEAPQYDPALITARGLTFWTSKNDAVVSPNDIQGIARRMEGK